MRHPTSGQNEDDLSRLTSSSTTTASTPSHDSSNCGTIVPAILSKTNSSNNLRNSQEFNSTYLPEIIDPLEWQKSRKRKERQDSTSSTTQDRKLVRSNSEELIPNVDYEVIRRVSSHEDFKKPLHEINDENILRTVQENELAKQYQQQQNHNNISYQYAQLANYETSKPRSETSPARSHRLSPHRDYRCNSIKYKENEDFDYEHERRRSSERFSRTRAPPGRRAGNTKKASKQIATRLRERDENVYKYDISAMKHERRGFVSKFKLEERARKEEAADGEQIFPASDLNDNNLIDFHISREYQSNSKVAAIAPLPPATNNLHSVDQQTISPLSPITTSVSLSSSSSSSSSSTSVPSPPPIQQSPALSSDQPQTIAEALPWDCSIQEDQAPVLCRRRFAAFDDYYSSGVVAPFPDHHLSSESPKSGVSMSESPPFGGGGSAFTNLENLKTREIMKNTAPMGLFQTPDERLRQVNKKLVALKKRVVQLEENFERNYGYRPSQSEKFNDKQIKNIMAEIVKLRKEKHQLKSDPMSALGLKVSGGMDAEKKLAKIKDTLAEIERKLHDKREEGCRSENLDDLNADQLVQEKSAVQHGLLYLESLYGRPSTREERDAARPLYDRYRILKRMVTRSVSISGNGSGIPELPTILEHEALDSFQAQSLVSTDTTTSPDGPQNSASLSAMVLGMVGGSIDSPTTADNSGSTPSNDSTDSSGIASGINDNDDENVHRFSVDELWEHLERVREEKRQLKRVIKEFEAVFEEQNGRKMLKTDRKAIEDTYGVYKQKKAKVRLLQALIKKKIDN